MENKKKNTGIDNTGENNSGNGNSGNWNSGYENSGNWNSGYWNSGNGNSGNWNSGDGNSGNWNSGDRNSGNGNSGNWNSGNRNSGNGNSCYENSGNWNSGYWNSGNGNSGNWNSGDGNSGNGNSGDRNSGYGNSTNRSSGIFCSEEETVRMFNKPTNLKWEEIDHPHFNEFYLNKWISEDEMTDEDKKADPEFYVRKGCLKTYTWKEAWANFWRDTSEENRQKFLNLPNFDSEIFEEITGIKVNQLQSLSGKTVKVEIDGVSYEATIK